MSGMLGGGVVSGWVLTPWKLPHPVQAYWKAGQGQSIPESVVVQKISTHQGNVGLANGLGGCCVGQGRVSVPLNQL